MQIQFNTSTMRLEEMPLDIGYASQKVTITDNKGVEYTIGGQNGLTQLIISAPFIDETFTEELKKISEMLPVEVEANIIVANDSHNNPKLEKFNFFIDKYGEFADYYGVRLVGNPCDSEFTKALILITKDGTIFYDEFTTNLLDRFNINRLLNKIKVAQTCYTGKGCH